MGRNDKGEVSIGVGTKFEWPTMLLVGSLVAGLSVSVAKASEAKEALNTASVTLHQHELRIQRTEDAISEIKKSNEKSSTEIKDTLNALIQELRKGK